MINKLPVTRVSADAIISKSITVKRTSIKQPRFLPPKNLQASVVQRLDSAIHWINLYPVDSAISFPDTYPLDSNFPVDSAIQRLNNRGQMTYITDTHIIIRPQGGGAGGKRETLKENFVTLLQSNRESSE